MGGPENLLKNIDKSSEVMTWVNGLVCLALPVLILIVVGIRSVIPWGIPVWSLDVCELLMWFLSFLAVGYVWRINKHVKITVFTEKMPLKIRIVVDLIISFISLIISIIMAWQGTKIFIISWMESRKTVNEFPEYLLGIAIPVGLLLLVYEISRSIVRKLRNTKAAS